MFDRTDRDREIEIGREVYDALVRRDLLSKNEAMINRVNRIFNTLLNALPEKLMPYQIVLVGTSEVNAFCTPGGYVCIYEGLVSQIKSDDALAMVLGHEMGHGYRRHTMRSMQHDQRNIIFETLLGLLTNTVPTGEGTFLSRLSFSREMEREADAFGVELYLKAGYDPAKADDLLQLFEHLDPEKRGDVPYYLRTHPPNDERIAAVRRRVKDLLEAGVKPIDPGKAIELAEASIFGQLPSETLASNPYFPLEPGMQWDYEIRGGGGGAYQVAVIGVAPIPGGKVARLRTSIAGTLVEHQSLTTAQGVYRRNNPDVPSSVWKPEFGFPAPDAPLSVDPWTFTRLGMEDLELPLGKISNTLKVEAKQGTKTFHLWFAEGIGLLRRLNVGSGIDEVLTSFKK